MLRACLHTFFAALLIAFTAPAIAGGHGTCAKCHDAEEFQGMSAASIAGAVKDASIPPHKKLELTDEQIEAIAQALAES